MDHHEEPELHPLLLTIPQVAKSQGLCRAQALAIDSFWFSAGLLVTKKGASTFSLNK